MYNRNRTARIGAQTPDTGLTTTERMRFDMAKKILTEILSGKTVFGDYVVVGEGKWHPKSRMVLCRCKCGTVKDVAADKLRSGRSKCCNLCAAKSERRITNLSHGMSRTSEYDAWSSMIERCTKPGSHNYEGYGARGIHVCDRWLHSFQDFFSDMGLRPTSDHSIDRVDNDGNYSPENCRWATRAEQQANRRVTRKVVVDGKEIPVSILEKEAGLARGVLSARLDMGWSLDRALSEPGRKKKPRHDVFGESMTTKELCEKFGVDRQSFNMRLRQGWTPEEAVTHYRTM